MTDHVPATRPAEDSLVHDARARDAALGPGFGNLNVDTADRRILLEMLDQATAELYGALDENDRLTRELDDARGLEQRIYGQLDRALKALGEASTELDDARTFARRFRAMTLDGFDNPTSASRQLGLGLSELPDWFTTPNGGPTRD